MRAPRAPVLASLAVLAAGGAAWWWSARGAGTRATSAVAAPASGAGRAPAFALGGTAVVAGASTGGTPGDRAVVEGWSVGSAEWTTSLEPPAVAAPLVRGRVLDESGAAVAGATVWASDRLGLPLDSEDADGVGLPGRVQATTDAAGAFELRGPRSGLIRIAVRAATFAPHRDDSVALGASARIELAPIVLERGAILSGRVIDAAGGGVAGATLALADAALGETLALAGFRARPLAASDAGGRFRVDQLACGPWTIEVTTAQHPSRVFSGTADRPGVEVGGLVFELEAGAAIGGRAIAVPGPDFARLRVGAELLAAEGAPVERASRRTVPRAAPLESDGTFALLGLELGRSYALQLFEPAGGMSPEALLDRFARSQRVVARAGEQGVVLAYERGSGISFRVVDGRTGDRLREFTVAYGVEFLRPLLGYRGETLDYHLDGEVYIDDLGVRTADELVQLEIRADGYETYRREDVSPHAGGRLDLGPIVLEPVPVLRVTVRDASSGKPIAGATLSLGAQGAGPLSAAERRFAHAVSAAWGSDEIASLGPASHGVVRTADDGVATLNAPRGQTCVLRVESPRHAPVELGDLVFSASEAVVEREVELTAGGTVVVQALDADGRAWAGIQIERRPPAERDGVTLPLPDDLARAQVTDEAGRLVFAQLEAGIHGFRFRKRARPSSDGDEVETHRIALHGEPGWTEIAVAEGATHEVALREPARVSLAGIVRAAGRPLSGANLTLVAPEGAADPGDGYFSAVEAGPRARTRTSGVGRYELAHLETGRFLLQVSHPDRSMDEERAVTLEVGENALDIDLSLATIRGTVADAAGAPLRGVRVAARRAGGAVRPWAPWSYRMLDGPNGIERRIARVVQDGIARTGDDGRYVLEGVTGGTPLVVIAWGDGYIESASEPLTLESDEVRERVDLRLAVGGDVLVEAAAADGSPARACIVEATRPDAPGAPAIGYIAVGSTTLRGLAPGTWSIRVAREGPVRAEGEREQEVEVGPGETARASFRLP